MVSRIHAHSTMVICLMGVPSFPVPERGCSMVPAIRIIADTYRHTYKMSSIYRQRYDRLATNVSVINASCVPAHSTMILNFQRVGLHRGAEPEGSRARASPHISRHLSRRKIFVWESRERHGYKESPLTLASIRLHQHLQSHT